MPQQLGSVTLSAADTATAASADRDQARGGRRGQVDQRTTMSGEASNYSPALPPFLRISSPASTANGCEAATTPFVPYTCDRRLANRWKTISGWFTFVQSTFMAERCYAAGWDMSSRSMRLAVEVLKYSGLQLTGCRWPELLLGR